MRTTSDKTLFFILLVFRHRNAGSSSNSRRNNSGNGVKTGEPLPPATLLALAAGATSTMDTTIGDADTANYRGDSCASFEYVARNKAKRPLNKNGSSPNGNGKSVERSNGKSNYANVERSNSKTSSNGTNGRQRRKLQSLERKNKEKRGSSSEENSPDKERSPKKEKSPNLDVKERSPSLDLEETRSRSASSGKSSKKDNSSQTEKRDLAEFDNISLEPNEEKKSVQEVKFKTDSVLDEQNLLKNMEEKSDCKKDIISLEELKNVNDVLSELGQENLLACARDLTPLVLGRCVTLNKPKSPVSLSDILKSSLEKKNSEHEEQISREPVVYGRIKSKNLERKSSFTFKNKSEPIHVQVASTSLDRKKTYRDKIDEYQNLDDEELEFLLTRDDSDVEKPAPVAKKPNRFLTMERKASEQEQKLLSPSPELNSPVGSKQIASRENSFRKKERPVGFHEEQFEKLKSFGSCQRKSPSRRKISESCFDANLKKEEKRERKEQPEARFQLKSQTDIVKEAKTARTVSFGKPKPVPPQVPPKPKKLQLERDLSSDEDLRSPISVKEMAICFSKVAVAGNKFPLVLTKEDTDPQER